MRDKPKGKPRGKPFARGNPDGRAGRPVGSKNKKTLEAMEFCASIVDDEQYRENLRKAAVRRRLSAQIEVMIWHYAKGKPQESIDINLPDGPIVQQVVIEFLKPNGQT